MVDVIKCAVCGENNSADQEFCQNCQSRLMPLTGPLKGADAPLQPGQLPTKKVTAELEPILPQWLREARDKARLSAEDDPSQGMQQFEPAPSGPASSEPDLLAGLRSQSRGGDDDDETPDWLASITGASPKSKKVDNISSEGRRVELGDIGDFARDTAPLQESTPSWLSSVQSASQDNDRDELKDWFQASSGLGEKNQAPVDDSAGWMAQAPQTSASLTSDDAPDWLKQMSDPAPADDSPPAWLDSDVQKDAQAAESSPFGSSPFGAFETDSPSTNEAPNWLQDAGSNPAASEASSETDWLKAFDAPKPAEQPLKKNTTPLWLRGTENTNTPAPEADTPVWLEDDSSSSSVPPLGSTPALTSDEQIGFGEIPSWLKAAAPQSSIFDTPATDTPPSAPAEPGGWASTFSDPPASSAFSFDQPAENEAPAAFTPDAFQDGSAEALFTEMPDWLSNASTPAAPGTSSPSSASDPLTPGDLPSWVQAMRPVDTGFSKPVSASDQTLETRGALSGLQGVLPAVPGFAPSSKPKIYSIKLQATQEQQAQAALLEQILAAEAEPVPITSFSPLRTSRTLRWLLSALVFVLLAGILFLPPGRFLMPSVVPGENNAVDGAMTVSANIPPDGLVLVAMDYHPARAAEMQALASPLFDQMMILRHPHLVFISTNETGPLLAELFMSGPMGERAYQYGSQYLNLGYLPGGVMGIRSFMQNPTRSAPFDVYLSPAWNQTDQPILLGVSSLSQFAAMIVITDDTESARAWVEQATPVRAITPLPLVLVSSSQVGPMLMPYYDAGQVNGLVSGLYDGAIAEQKNFNRPGTVRLYWDAFSVGILLAVAVMVFGGLGGAALGFRDRLARGGRA